ncbi:uncharacterized protein P174DRAFT_443576, partial [Aspergillus novofumigatus IBT 16806]
MIITRCLFTTLCTVELWPFKESLLVKLRQSISDPASRGDKTLSDWQRKKKKEKRKERHMREYRKSAVVVEVEEIREEL